MLKRSFLIASVLLGALLALITIFPLKWIAPIFAPRILPPNLRQDAQYSGSIWNGQIQLNFNQALVPVRFSLSPSKLIKGEAFIDFNMHNPAVQISGRASFNSLETVKIFANMQYLNFNDPRIRGLKGQIAAQILSAKFDSSCQELSGQIETNFLQSNPSHWYWSGPALKGPLSCTDSNVIVQMSGGDREQDFTVILRFKPDGNYDMEVKAQSAKPRADVVLQFYGFQSNGTDLILTEQGRWF